MDFRVNSTRAFSDATPTSKLAAVLGALAVLLVLVFQLRSATLRYIDPDELVHLNAAWLVAHGETLYGSLFENHPPLTNRILQPFVRSTERPEAMIRSARYGMQMLAVATLLVVGWMATRLIGLACGAAAAVLLSSHTYFFQKTLEVRPDVPALLLLSVALALLALPPGAERRRRALASGALLCLAGLFTPKVIYAAAGATLGAALAAAASAERLRYSAALRTAAWIALGAGSVAGIAALEMAREGILPGFLSDVVGTSLRMRIDDPSVFRRHYVLETLIANPATWGLATLGLVTTVRARGGGSPAASLVLGTSLATGLVGLFAISAPLRQFFLTFLVPVAFFAALGFVQVVRAADAWRPGVGALALVGLLTAVLVPPGLALRLDAESMDKQLRVLDRVLELTRPEDRVFDCWTGLYLTRRPAHRYFYLNTDIQRLFEPSALQARLLAALRNPEVRLVIWDRDCARLPAGVRHYVANEFTPDRRIAFLKVR